MLASEALRQIMADDVTRWATVVVTSSAALAVLWRVGSGMFSGLRKAGRFLDDVMGDDTRPSLLQRFETVQTGMDASNTKLDSLAAALEAHVSSTGLHTPASVRGRVRG